MCDDCATTHTHVCARVCMCVQLVLLHGIPLQCSSPQSPVGAGCPPAAAACPSCTALGPTGPPSPSGAPGLLTRTTLPSWPEGAWPPLLRPGREQNGGEESRATCRVDGCP